MYFNVFPFAVRVVLQATMTKAEGAENVRLEPDDF
jgi:hypothetical protein